MANENEAPNRIAELRRARGLTQEVLAERAGMHQTTLSKIEKGDRELDQDHMRRLAPHLGVAPAELLPLAEQAMPITDDERELLLRLRAADPRGRETFDRVAAAMLPALNEVAQIA